MADIVNVRTRNALDATIIKEELNNIKRVSVVNRMVDKYQERIALEVINVTLFKNDVDEWAVLPESVRGGGDHVVITNDKFIDPATGLLVASDAVGAMPAYDYFSSLSAADIGLRNITAPIESAINAVFEKFLTDNNLI